MSLRALPKPRFDTACPCREWRSEGRLIKPLILLLDVVDLAHDIGTVCVAAAQADGVVSDAKACARYAAPPLLMMVPVWKIAVPAISQPPSSECVRPGLDEEGQLVDVVHVEDMASVVTRRSLCHT